MFQDLGSEDRIYCKGKRIRNTCYAIILRVPDEGSHQTDDRQTDKGQLVQASHQVNGALCELFILEFRSQLEDLTHSEARIGSIT